MINKLNFSGNSGYLSLVQVEVRSVITQIGNQNSSGSSIDLRIDHFTSDQRVRVFKNLKSFSHKRALFAYLVVRWKNTFLCYLG